jgi:hypothetical protein|tara:strand:- start:1482 stop:2339 length:858 start_codon:yes stop_codon:yes gene_type:complete
MNEAQRLRDLLDGSMDPSELESYKEYYKLAERIYGREALDEIGISSPQEVEENQAPTGNSEFTHDVILPEPKSEIIENQIQQKEIKSKRRVLVLIVGMIGLILVSTNIAVGVNSIVDLCEDEDPMGEIEFRAQHQVNGNTITIFWTVTNTTIDSQYSIKWDVSQNGSQELVGSGEINWTANGESFSHSNMTTVQIEPYAYSSTLFGENETVIATVSGSHSSSEVSSMSTIESSKLCEDNPKLKLSEIMNYDDINSWESQGEGDIIDGMLLMLFTFIFLFGLTKKK